MWTPRRSGEPPRSVWSRARRRDAKTIKNDQKKIMKEKDYKTKEKHKEQIVTTKKIQEKGKTRKTKTVKTDTATISVRTVLRENLLDLEEILRF